MNLNFGVSNSSKMASGMHYQALLFINLFWSILESLSIIQMFCNKIIKKITEQCYLQIKKNISYNEQCNFLLFNKAVKTERTVAIFIVFL